MKKWKNYNQGAIGTIVIFVVIAFIGAATLIGKTEAVLPYTELEIFIYSDEGYYAVEEQECFPRHHNIIYDSIDIEINKENLIENPWLCNRDDLPYYYFKTNDHRPTVVEIDQPIGTTCNEVKIAARSIGCVIFRRSSGYTCIFEESCTWNTNRFSPGTPDLLVCNEIKNRVYAEWTDNRKCIVNAPYFFQPLTSIYAKISAISSPTPTPTTAAANTPTTAPTNTVSPSCPKKAQGDANCDGKIDIEDYEIILSALQGNDISDLCDDAEDCSADINGDSNITILDYTIWLNSFLNINSTT